MCAQYACDTIPVPQGNYKYEVHAHRAHVCLYQVRNMLPEKRRHGFDPKNPTIAVSSRYDRQNKWSRTPSEHQISISTTQQKLACKTSDVEIGT